MSRLIKITTGDIVAQARLKDTPTAAAIFEAIPFEGVTEKWQNEIYFSVPVQAELEDDARSVLKPGELGFWPEGRTLCIFFGATGDTENDETRNNASAVNVFASLVGDWDIMRDIPEGADIRIEKIESDDEDYDEGDETNDEAEGTDDEEGNEDIVETITDQEATDEGLSRTDTEDPELTAPVGLAEEIEGEEDFEDIPTDSAEEAEQSDYIEQIYQGAIETVGVVEIEAEQMDLPDESQQPDSPGSEKPSIFAKVSTKVSVIVDHARELYDRFEMVPITAAIIIASVTFLIGVIVARMGSGPVADATDMTKPLGKMQLEIDGNRGAIADTTRSMDSAIKLGRDNESKIVGLQKQDDKLQRSLVAGMTTLQRGIDAVKNKSDILWIRNAANGHSYCVSPYPMPWHTAKAYAEHIGGHMVTIANDAENEWLVRMFGPEVEYWVGLTDELEEDNWKWVTGEEADYANWAPGEPDNYRKNQHHVMINSTVPDRGYDEPGKWNDVPGNDIHMAIIEKDG